MISYIRQLFKAKYPTLNRLEISAAAIKNNFSILQAQQPQAQIIPVLKSNAYGHGLKEICQILNQTKAKIVAIDSYPEAQIVYRHFQGRVLLIGEMPASAYKYLRWPRTEICIYNSVTLRALVGLGVKAKVHLFINTGMNREGIKDLKKFWSEHLDCWPHVEIKGLCSHLADAEGDNELNKIQQEKFFADLEFLHTHGCFPEFVHLGNSAGTFVLQDKRLTAFRPGLAIYGYSPFPATSAHYKATDGLKPALRLLSTVVSVQALSAGEIVSYNAGYQAVANTQIAVIPFGYYEGLDRRLSNLANFQLLDGDKKIIVKLAGKVCMNLCCLDVGREEGLEPGREVILISPEKSDVNSLENLARLQGSIVYELLVKLQANIRKVIV